MVAAWRAAVGTLAMATGLILPTLYALAPCLALLRVRYMVWHRASIWIIAQWHAWSAFLFESVWGIRYHVSGDDMREGDCSIFISNHRTRLDWAFLWPYLARFWYLTKLHIMLKSDIKKLPILGWGTQMARYIFMSRSWEQDEAHLDRMLTFIGKGDDTYTLLMFPEGTDLHPRGIEKSNEFAAKHGVAPYTYVLHPRTTGFVHTLQQLRQVATPLTAVYDATIAFTGAIPQSELHLVKGRTPTDVHVHVRRYAASELPSDKAAIADWVKARFVEKERVLHHFYSHGAVNLAAAVASVTSASHTTPSAEAADGKAVPSGAAAGGAPLTALLKPVVDTPVSGPAPARAPTAHLPVLPYMLAAVWQVTFLYLFSLLASALPLFTLAMGAAVIVFFKFAAPALGGLDVMEMKWRLANPHHP